MIHCKHWIACTNKDGGCCTEGLMGGMPSYGSCLGSCAEYTGTDEDKVADWQFVRDRAKEVKPKASVQVAETEKGKRLGLLEAAKRIGGGIWGVVKAEAGIDRATELLATTRMNTCKTCENYVPCWKDSDKMCCGPMIASIKSTRTCGCWLSKKVRITAEKCPIDKW